MNGVADYRVYSESSVSVQSTGSSPDDSWTLEEYVESFQIRYKFDCQLFVPERLVVH